jgi:hypothetical protein
MLPMPSKAYPAAGQLCQRDREVEGPEVAEYQHGTGCLVLLGHVWSLFADCVLQCSCETGGKRENPLLLTCKRSCKRLILRAVQRVTRQHHRNVLQSFYRAVLCCGDLCRAVCGAVC